MSRKTVDLSDFSPNASHYFRILSPEFPSWLGNYAATPEMLRLKKLNKNCGIGYIKLYNCLVFRNVWEHSIGCALIVWNFTKDKKQTLAALFHDISTPVFKHSIEFLDGDYEIQQPADKLNVNTIRKSSTIMKLLEEDGIELEEVCNCPIHTISHNDYPRLSPDNLESTFRNADFFSSNFVKKIYDDLEIQINEDGIQELGFKTKSIAEYFVYTISLLWFNECDNRYKITAKFYADMINRLVELGALTRENIYKYSDVDVIMLMECSGDRELSKTFKLFQNTTKFYEGNDQPSSDKYFISFDCKKRYLNPLVNINGEYKRIYDVSENIKYRIDKFLEFETKKYAYFDFNFKDIEKTLVKRKKLY